MSQKDTQTIIAPLVLRDMKDDTVKGEIKEISLGTLIVMLCIKTNSEKKYLPNTKYNKHRS